MSDLVIAGSQISLRDMRVNDLEDYEHWLHPKHQWHKFNGPYYPPTPSEQIPEIIKKTRSRLENSSFPDFRTRFTIADKKSDSLIGIVTRYWISEETNWTALGIVIYDSDHWGKGIGYEALGLWCDYLLKYDPKFVRLDLRTWSGNLGMIKLAQKLGFSEEARFRKARIVEGAYYDGLGYGILREEWEKRYINGFKA